MKLRDKMNENRQVLAPMSSKVTAETFYVHPSLKRDLEGVIGTIRNIDKFGTEMGDRNYILAGPPGTGKTLAAQYIAGELNIPIFDGKSLMDAQSIAMAFAQLREQVENSPNGVMLILNEIDRFSSRDQVVDPTQRQTLNKLLDEMDGYASNDKIFIFGTTNMPNSLDAALRRPKRFSKEVYFMAPDKNGRNEILKIHAKGKGGHKFEVQDKDLEEVSKVTFGYTGADLVGLLNEAFTNAILEKRTKIEYKDFKYALTKTKPSALKDMPFKEPQKKFNDLGGYDDHKEVLRRVVENSNGSLILFYGPKGTGKTEFSEAIAGEYGYNYIVVSGSAPEDKFVGETGKLLDKYLDRAKQLAPCVLLFDEMDALVEKKGFVSHKSGWTGLLQSKLSKPIEGVYIIGTVNRPDLINGTFLDRFVHRLYFGMPDAETQEKIWKVYLPDDLKKSALDLVMKNNNLSCRDISRATRIVTDYGVSPTLEVYNHLIENIRKGEEESDKFYVPIIGQVGDSVSDYRGIKEFTHEKVEKVKGDKK